MRETARAVAIRHGLWASFAPKPLPEQAGNGAHLHASLWRTAATRSPIPLTWYGLSAVGYHFLAGVLAHLPGLVALTCGSVTDYRRLAPQCGRARSPVGPDNREAALRICSPIGSRGSVNLELKPVDSTGNPYLASARSSTRALTVSGGRCRRASPCLSTPAVLDDSERQRLAVVRLPSSLRAALDALAADSFLMSALGPLRSTAYLAVKRSEVEHFRVEDAEYERRRHWLTF